MTNNPVTDLVRKALDFVNRAAGEGIEIDGLSPEEFLYEYSLTTGDEDWDTFPDRIPAEIARLTRERDQAIEALSKAAEARGRAEGKLAASEIPGIVDGWKARAEKAEAERDQALARAALLNDGGWDE